MQITKTPIEGLLLIKLDLFGDERGFFVERFNEERFKSSGLPSDFVQDNHSRSAPGVLRGLHYQFEKPQGKLVGVTNGKIFDIAVDIRKNSPTFGKYYGVELDDISGLMLWIPAGFAHGFCVLGEKSADVLYKTTSLYNPSGEGGIMWNDKDINIKWPIDNPTISERDKKQTSLAEYSNNSKF